MLQIRSVVGLVAVVLLAACVGPTAASEEAPTGTVSAALTTYRPARVTIASPVLNVQTLHDRWASQWIPPDPCHWQAYKIGNAPNAPAGAIAMPTIDRALTTSAATDVCGPVLWIGSGRYADLPSYDIKKPTIIVGDNNGNVNNPVTISASFVSTKGQPLWMQDVTIDNAPFPGAILASHWNDETTLLRVTINQAAGVGIIQNGGTFAMYDSLIQNGTAPTNPYADPRVNATRIKNGFGEPANNANPTRIPPVMHRLDPVIDQAVTDLGPVGADLRPIVQSQRATRAYDSFDFGMVASGVCSGTGAIFRGGITDLGRTYAVANAGGGIAIFNAFATAVDLGASFNGLTVRDDSFQLIPSMVNGVDCYGGIHVHPDSALITEGGGAIGNKPDGIASARRTYLVMGRATVVANDSWRGNNAWGDGIMLWGKFGSFTDLMVESNLRIGVNVDNGAAVNFFSGDSRFNNFGVAIAMPSTKLYYNHQLFTVVQNIENDWFFPAEWGGDFSVPVSPAAL